MRFEQKLENKSICQNALTSGKGRLKNNCFFTFVGFNCVCSTPVREREASSLSLLPNKEGEGSSIVLPKICVRHCTPWKVK